MDQLTQRMIDGANRYAQADKSDLFALRRALAHIRVGICGYNHEGKPAWYDAEAYTETRHLNPGMTFSNGDTSFQATGWKNRVRP